MSKSYLNHLKTRTGMTYFMRVCDECKWVLYNTEVEDCPICHKKLRFATSKDKESKGKKS